MPTTLPAVHGPRLLRRTEPALHPSVEPGWNPLHPGRLAPYGSSPDRRAATTAWSRVCTPNFRMDDRR
jgi:hypothetical protein